MIRKLSGLALVAFAMLMLCGPVLNMEWAVNTLEITLKMIFGLVGALAFGIMFAILLAGGCWLIFGKEKKQ